MPTAAALRLQIETSLARRIPSALTPAPRTIRPVAATGIRPVDELLEGGLPLGAITEIVGSECSGRTSFALSFIAQMTQAAKVCAWIDVSNALSPESAAAIGMDLDRLLWVRCGVTNPISATPSSQSSFSLPERYLIAPPAKKGLHGGGFGPHPRGEAKGLSTAVGGLLRPEAVAPRCAEPQPRVKIEKEIFQPNPPQSIRSTKKHSLQQSHGQKSTRHCA
ncbi:ATPase domain-containing protein [Tunturiibacter gelidiferens]|uniref:ATPase domain-containing protein n=1 Tax=Tunturiibacter gelidiferens TaxID=3069689 RepID=UPI003D9BB78C